MDLLYDFLFILKEGYVVLAIVLYLAHKFSVKYSILAKDLLNNLAWVIMAICLGIFVQWSIEFAEYYKELADSEYEQYTFSQRFFGPYGWAYWGPMLLVLGVLILNLFNRFRTNLLVLLLGMGLCFGSYYYTLFNYWIASQREFLKVTWHYSFPPWYKIVLAFILNAAICLLLISIPKIYKLLRKQ